jgi:hypothetical protein
VDVIPPQKYTYSNHVQFATHWDDRESEKPAWYLFGPGSMLAEGRIIDVARNSDGATSKVQVLEWVAARSVTKAGGNRVQFVLAMFDNVLEEDDAVSVDDADHGDARRDHAGYPVVADRSPNLADDPTYDGPR